jgi:hypothetical protein
MMRYLDFLYYIKYSPTKFRLTLIGICPKLLNMNMPVKLDWLFLMDSHAKEAQ